MRISQRATVGAQVRTAAATLSIRANLSMNHLVSASMFAWAADVIESEHNQEALTDELRSAHHSNVMAAIFFSVASLEALINEVFADALEGNKARTGDRDELLKLLAALWPTIERAPVLEKYQIALAAAGVRTFNRGTRPFQDADALIILRNALIHFVPEWDTKQKRHKTIGLRLGQRFAHSPFAVQGDAFFPMKCLGHGCAEWAVKTATGFEDEFCKRMNFRCQAPGHGERLRTKACQSRVR